LIVILIAWVAASVVVGWLTSRWFRWMRGDFDRK
jgi:hypothetical protein